MSQNFTISDLEPMTTGDITKTAMKELDLKGYEVWRSNNVAIRGRAFIGRKGVSDIIGFERCSGRFVLCEVKKKGDTLSKDQIELLNEAKKAGCVVFLATVDDKGRYDLRTYEIREV